MPILFLVLAAALEVGGDAFCRVGIRDRRLAALLLGGAVLWVYGITVNVPRWDFGRLLGVYIALFFVVSQIVAVFVFREPVRPPLLVGGALIVAGGLTLVLWGGAPAPASG